VAPSTTIRASAGTAYRAQNGLESYVNLDLNTAADGYFVAFQGSETDGDPDVGLDPERILAVELGARDESSAFHALDVAVYWNRVTDLIDIASVVPELRAYEPDGGGYPFGESSWFNTQTVYDAVGGEADVTVFPVDGLDVYANVSVERIWGTTPGGEHFVDGSTALVRANAGVLYRAPFRMDFTLSAHYTSRQLWRVPTFDAGGQIIVEERETPDRVLLVARIAGRPVVKPEIELALTLWNPLGFADATAFREHPDGQIVGPRLFGTVSAAF
jgi:iron complex outermembrane receptor protein